MLLIFSELARLLLYMVVALVMASIVLRGSKFLFGIHLSSEVSKGNHAAAYVLLGLLLMIGLVVGLFRL